jgi:hypothetical protein
VKYVNGEISGQEFINEIGTKGTNMVVGMIGGEIGGEIGMLIGGVLGTAALPGLGTVEGATAGKVVGEILGTIITTVACSAVMTAFNTVKHMEDYKLTENNIRRIEKEALEEMANQRDKFRKIVEREYKVWDETIENGFDQILSCACRETADVTGVSEGIDKVLAVFGKSVRFKNLDEYEAQLDLPLKLSF